MSARKAIAIFLGWLIVAFFFISLATIYGFDYYERALGSREDNLLLSAGVNTAVALVITIGFGTVLLWRRSSDLTFPGLRLPLAAAVACALVYAFTVAGIFLSVRFGSWQLNLAVLTLYCAIVGAVMAAALIRFSNGREHAA